MGLTSGIKLGPYEIVAPVGAGGMGEVYRARDTRLDRTVAIKILPESLSCNAEAKQRFDREARAISSLNHPNICHLYDIGSQDGTDYLVMEFLEGETLADRLRKGALPLNEIFRVGMAVAEALAVAHRQGLVHRDLKPGNIMLTESGGVKLLDFGLAKAAGTISANPKSAPLLSAVATVNSASPQLSPLTTAGALVGTIQYMSPEQIEGREADARSDIFAFGAVVYEMVTGRRAFEGKSQISVASAILEKEPQPIKESQRSAPAALEYLIHTCLAKNPEERYQSALDIKLQLRYIAEIEIAETGLDLTTSGASRRGWRKMLAWSLAIALASAALALAATYVVTRPAPGSPLMVSVIPPAGVFPDIAGRNGPPQISLDGKKLAFVGCKTVAASASIAGSKSCSIWVRSMNSSDAHEVAGTGGGYAPFWSPDGREIGFFADGKLRRVAADGGAVQVICDADDARGGSWTKSGTIIFAATRGSPILRVSSDGGTPVALTRSAPASSLAETGSHRWPHFLPDGEHFTYVNAPNGACTNLTEMHFAALDGKQDVALMRSCSTAGFAAGHLIFWRDGNLVAQPFDPAGGTLSGTAVPVAQHVGFDLLFSFPEFSASDGVLAYVSGEGPTGARLVWYDEAGKILGTLGDNANNQSVSISRDGSRVVVNTTDQGESSIRILDARGTRTLVTTVGGNSVFPVFSADGRQVYFSSNKNGPYDIFVKAVDGSGDEREVLKFDKGRLGAVFLTASPDGKYLAFETVDPITKREDVSVLPLEGDHTPRPFLHSSVDHGAPAFSPDGKWLAYESIQGGRREVYMSPFPAGDAEYAVSTNGGERPVWRRDGKEIFYRENLRLMAVAVKAKGDAVELSAPNALFEVAARNLNGRWFDVGPDGRLLMNTAPSVSQAQNFELLVNWPAELNK